MSVSFLFPLPSNHQLCEDLFTKFNDNNTDNMSYSVEVRFLLFFQIWMKLNSKAAAFNIKVFDESATLRPVITANDKTIVKQKVIMSLNFSNIVIIFYCKFWII